VPEEKSGGSWWKTLPGIMTGIATMLTAIGGLIMTLHQTGIIGSGNQQKTQTESVITEPSIKPETESEEDTIWGIPLPAYVILDSAWEKKQEAQKRLVTLNHSGYSNTGYFWIPDFEYLSGAELFQVYIGPFDKRSDAITALCAYEGKFKTTTYGVKLSNKPGREEIHC
jgi:serine/threonine-protein kinase